MQREKKSPHRECFWMLQWSISGGFSLAQKKMESPYSSFTRSLTQQPPNGAIHILSPAKRVTGFWKILKAILAVPYLTRFPSWSSYSIQFQASTSCSLAPVVEFHPVLCCRIPCPLSEEVSFLPHVISSWRKRANRRLFQPLKSLKYDLWMNQVGKTWSLALKRQKTTKQAGMFKTLLSQTIPSCSIQNLGPFKLNICCVCFPKKKNLTFRTGWTGWKMQLTKGPLLWSSMGIAKPERRSAILHWWHISFSWLAPQPKDTSIWRKSNTRYIQLTASP